jgi:CYTH domain-containing protein/CHAD domain-containing protein
MSGYVLEPSASLERQIRRVTRERLDEALSILGGLDGADGPEIETAVHDVRKRCKEVRAVARLVRSALGDHFDRFNCLVRDAARELAPIRDAHAMLATFDDLQARRGLTDVADLDGVRSGQLAAVVETTRGVHGTDPRIERARTLLTAGRENVEEWEIPDDFATLAVGLDDTYRRGRRALRRARDKPTDRRMHEWRRSVKHLWYQVRLIERAAPSVLEAMVASLDDLAEALGDDHDLAVLIERLAADPERFGGKRQVKQARRLARAQQRDLRRRAFRLGATVFAEPDRSFARRMRAYWETTVDEGPELATGGIAELTHDEQRAAAAASQSRTVERERKFLVSMPPPLTDHGVALRQGYLAIDGTVSVRVRDATTEGCTMTVKAGRGAVRTELEWALTPEQFAAAWEQTRGRRIHKTRHRIPADGYHVDLDVFHAEHDGLVLAEVEFDTDDAMAAFCPPAWFGLEVTDDDTYTNASLSVNAPRGTPTR